MTRRLLGTLDDDDEGAGKAGSTREAAQVKRKMLAPGPEDDEQDQDTEPLRRKAMKRCVKVVLLLAMLLPVAAGAQSPGRSFEWACSLDNIGATLTQCRHAPEPGMRLYLTSVVITSTTATPGLFLIRSGTGTNCGTSTASILPAAATVPRLGYPANTSAPAVISQHSPLVVPSASALCVICTVTNTCTVDLAGYLAP